MFRKTTIRNCSSESWSGWGAEGWGRQLWTEVEALFWCCGRLSILVIFLWKLPYQFIQNKTAIMWKLWRRRKEHNDPFVINIWENKSRFSQGSLKEMLSIELNGFFKIFLNIKKLLKWSENISSSFLYSSFPSFLY